MARMVPDRLPRRRYPCRFCGVSFAALLVTQAPDGAVLLIHLSAMHRDRVGHTCGAWKPARTSPPWRPRPTR